MEDDIDTPHIEDRASVLHVSNPGGEMTRNILSKQFWRDWGQLREPKGK